MNCNVLLHLPYIVFYTVLVPISAYTMSGINFVLASTLENQGLLSEYATDSPCV